MRCLASLFLLLVVFLPMQAQKVLHGKAVRIMDGDTFELLDETQTLHKVRLFGIDAPEKGQAYGQVSKQALSGLIYARDVKVMYKGKDRHGRVLGEVYCGGDQVNLRLVVSGMAWHFTRYSSDIAYAKAQQKARMKRLGLWVQNRPQAPWDFRSERRHR